MNSSGTFGSLLDSWQLQDYVMAVIDEPANADRAVKALTSAGFGSEDVKRWRGHEIVSLVSSQEEHKNVVQKAVDVVKTGLSDEGLAAKDFEEEAKLGHDILAIRFADRETLEQLRVILTRYGAHTIRAAGSLTMEDLS